MDEVSLPITPEAYHTAMAALKNATNQWNAGITWGCVLYPDGKRTGGQITSACHAFVGYAFTANAPLNYSGGKYTGFQNHARDFLIGSCFKPSMIGCTKESAEKFVLWVTTDTPFSKHILNKHDQESVMNSGVLLFCGPTGLALNEALWVCKALRYCVESGQAIDAWAAMVDGGVNPYVALAACQHVRANELVPGVGRVFKCTGAPIWHNSVFQKLTKDELPLVLQAKPFSFASSTHSLFVEGKTASVNYYDKASYERDMPLYKLLAKGKVIKTDDGWGGSITAEGFTADELVKTVLSFQNQVEFKTEPAPEIPVVTSETIYLDGDL